MSAGRRTDLLRAGYDRSAADYDARFRSLQHAKYAAMLDADEALGTCLRSGPLLDLGCGTGLAAEYLAARRSLPEVVVGLDLSHRMLQQARRRPVHVVQGDATMLPFPAQSFATVLAFTVLALWQDDHAATRQSWREIGRVVRPGGVVVVTVLASAADAGFAALLDTTDLTVGDVRRCGQDVGYVCHRAR
jgi:SAM-dependent methyltransferase